MKAFKKWRKENVYFEICTSDWHNGAELKFVKSEIFEHREALDVIEDELEEK